MRILIADDSKTTLALTMSALKKLGHIPIDASSGQEAIEKFQTEHPDLIILDVVMEGMNGFQCAEKIREIEQIHDWVPIIFLSSEIDNESIAKGINAGGDDYLTKPFSEITLAAKIKAMQRIVDMRKELFQLTQKLSLLSATDTLTGLYNRLQFNNIIKEEIAYAKRHKSIIALLFMDLDNFKNINDSLGHYVGDLVLKETASRLKTSLRESDFVARLGGDEFAIILRDLEDTNDAGKIAQKIIEILNPTYKVENHEIELSTSIGIALYPYAGENPTTLIQNADVAMYRTKKSGGNNYQFYTTEINDDYAQYLLLEKALKEALVKQELVLMYQPVFNLKSRELIGLDVTTKWINVEYGLISPETFNTIAEKSGMLDEIRHWMIVKVCQQINLWKQLDYKLPLIMLSISSYQLLQTELPLLKNILSEYKIQGQELEFSLFETLLMKRNSILEYILFEIHKMGIQFAINNFGTGFFSLNHLTELPIHNLKIDSSFIEKISLDPNAESIIKSIIAIGENLSLNITAKGIKTESQLKFLETQGCLNGEGLFLHDYMNTDEATNYLAKQAAKNK